MKKIIIPAVISKTQRELDDIFSRIRDSARLLQLDIMDGKFVPNNSLDFDFKLPEKKYLYEAHLMVDKPETWIDEYWPRVDTVIAHFESVENPERIIESVKDKGKKIAFALNPETGIDSILSYLDRIDQVLIMTVKPGFYGSEFLPEMSDKIRKLRKLRPDLDLEVDGGIKPETIEKVNEAGANMFVSGSYLINSNEVEERIRILKKKIRAD
jgi:ribulose-phosphate 3-epimerase